MKKFLVSVAVAISAVLFSSCGGVGGGANSSSSTSSSVSSSTTTSTSAATGGSVLGSILGATANGETLGNVLSSVLGIDRITQKISLVPGNIKALAVRSQAKTHWQKLVERLRPLR